MTLDIVVSHVYCWPAVRRGGERYLHELAAALSERGHRVTVLSSSAIPGEDRVLGVPTVRLAGGRPGGWSPGRQIGGRWIGARWNEDAAFAMRALAWVARRPVDVWHALGPSDAAAAAWLSRRGRLRSVHTSLGLPSRPYWEGRPGARAHHFAVRHVDRFVCLSSAAERVLADSYGRRGDVVGGGVDLRRFAPGPPRHPDPVLLYSGSLDEGRKQVGLLLAAAALLLPEHPKLKVWLSGTGETAALLAAAPPEILDHVVELGPGGIEDQARRYGAAWVTVLPAIYEAFGLCLVESLACGTPIVARADSGGAAELITGGVGALAGPGAAGLAAACRSALALVGAPGTVPACRQAAARFEWSTVIAPAIEALYR